MSIRFVQALLWRYYHNGAIDKAKCSFADEKFNAMEVKAPYVNLASEHFEKGEHKKALELFEKLGKAGDTDSQVMAGLIYSTSDKVSQNVAKAKEWYLKAMEYKPPVAAYNLGAIYEDENNHKKAKFYYQKACEWGRKQGCEALEELK